MRIAVVTPFWCSDQEFIEDCHQSILNQTYYCHHIIVCDGCPPPIISDDRQATTTIIRLKERSNDFGNTPRGVGSILALERGFDAIFFLDADNWFASDHVSSVLSHGQSSSGKLCISRRIIVAIDGTPLGLCDSSDGIQFADTSTMALLGRATEYARKWLSIESKYSAIGDRIFFKDAIALDFHVQRTERATVAYRARHAAFYDRVSLAAPIATRRNSGIREAVEAFKAERGLDLSVNWSITPWNECSPKVHQEWKGLRIK